MPEILSHEQNIALNGLLDYWGNRTEGTVICLAPRDQELFDGYRGADVSRQVNKLLPVHTLP
jgi:hypothetical protein